MDHITLAYPRLVFLLKAFQRFNGIPLSRLDLDWEHLVFQLAVVGYQKIYLNIIAVFIAIILRIEIQLVTVCCQHLSDSVLIEHSLVHVQLVAKYLLVDFIFKQFVLVKGVADKQTRITEVTFYIRPVLVN